MNGDGRTLGELFTELTTELRTLVQQEMQLARVEIRTAISRMTRHVIMIAAGAAVAFGGFLALVATVVLLLAAAGLPPWAAALVGGLVVAGVGYLLIRSGLSGLKHEELAPRQTIASLQEDTRWLKRQAG